MLSKSILKRLHIVCPQHDLLSAIHFESLGTLVFMGVGGLFKQGFWFLSCRADLRASYWGI